jgi:hypothetical protein
VHALPSLAAWTTYSPSFTNVSSGAGTFKYLLHGKTLFLKGHFSAGTATALGIIQISLPAGMTAVESVVIAAQNNNTQISGNIVSGGSAVRVFSDLAVGNFAAGASIASVHYDCPPIELT